MELAALHSRLETLLGARMFKLVRFLIAGGIAAASNLVIFFALVEFFNVYYLYASIASFVLSLAVSFTLQKFWTFQDAALRGVSMQFARYAVVLSFSLLLNIALMYAFVEKLGLWDIVAQALTIVAVAIFNYFGYQYFVFRVREEAP